MAIASNAVMSCIIACIPARIDRHPASFSRFIAAVRSVAIAGAIAPIAVAVLMELGVPNPVPALDTPAVSHQLQQGFWGGAQAGVAPRGAPGEPLEVGGLKWLDITTAGGHHLHDPAGADPGRTNVLRCLFRPQYPGDVAAMADLLIRCDKRDVTLSLELALDLAVQGLLVGFDGQEEVGPLLLELPKNGRWVCKASA